MKYYSKRGTTWETLPIGEKLRLINLWHVVSLFGNICLLIGIMMFYLTFSFRFEEAEAFFGFGTFFIWFSFTQYLTTLPKYSTIWRTVVKATPPFSRTLLGVLPILFGTAMLLYVLLFKNYKFFAY
jgi:hypothetical protein